MAITVTLLTDGASTVDGTTFTTASVSPTAGRVLFVLHHMGGIAANVDSTVTGLSGTWTQVGKIRWNTNHQTSVHRCTNYTGSGTLAIANTDSATNCLWAVAEADGADTTNPVVAGSFVTIDAGSVSSVTLTLNAPANASNKPIAVFVNDNNTAGEATPRTNWTELSDRGIGTPTRVMETQWQSAGAYDTAASVTWIGGPYTSAGVAFEVAVAGAATQTLVPTSIATEEVVPSPTLTTGAVTVAPTSIATAESVPSPTVTTGVVVVAPTSVPTAESVPSPTLTVGAVSIAPPSIPTAESVPSPTVTTGAVTVAPTSIGSEEAFGTPSLTSVTTVAPTSIGSEEAVPSPTVTAGAVTVAPPSIPTAESVPSPTLTVGAVAIAPPSIGSEEAFGTPVVATDQVTVFPDSIPTAESVPSPTVTTGAVTVAPPSIGSEESVPGPTVTTGGVTIAPPSIGSEESVPSPTVAVTAQVIAPPSIGSKESVPSPSLLVTVAQTIGPVSISSREAFGKPIVSQSGGVDDVPAPCLWTIDTGCCPGWAEYDPALQEDATNFATLVLWAATGRRFGLCAIVVRPCGRYTGGSPSIWGYFDDGHGGLEPYQAPNGSWHNCNCGSSCGSCAPVCEIYLPGPVDSVIEVVVGGVVVPAASYEVHDGRWLVRTDGDCWPDHSDWGSPAGLQEFEVTYMRGEPVPAGLKAAAGTLACEWAKACLGQECRLPQRMSSIARQGVQITMVDTDTLLRRGLTGLTDVDQVIQALNPNRLTHRMRVMTPDLRPPRMVTG